MTSEENKTCSDIDPRISLSDEWTPGTPFVDIVVSRFGGVVVTEILSAPVVYGCAKLVAATSFNGLNMTHDEADAWFDHPDRGFSVHRHALELDVQMRDSTIEVTVCGTEDLVASNPEEFARLEAEQRDEQ